MGLKIENLHKNNNLKLLTENAYKTVSDSFNINKTIISSIN